MNAAEIEALLPYLTPEERAELDALLAADPAVWRPLPGPQCDAYFSQADITGFGGAAGGGKTDLACGLALTAHRKSMILRENGTELTGVIDRLAEILKSREGYNGKDNLWRYQDRQIEFGSYPNPGDERKYQGRPHDLLVFDEVTNQREAAVRFLMGWLRTTTTGQRCRVLMTFNPPTSAEGRWVVAFFAPWLDPKHPNPARPGELRWFAVVNGVDIEVPDRRPFVLVDGAPVYDFNPAAHKPTEIITPLSRTFIPSRVSDNPYLVGTAYINTLQALPEPLRSQMLNGDFQAGIEDDAWQVIPTRWVEIAQARWQALDPRPPMDSMGVDVARGGKDKTVIATRHGMWFDKFHVYPGSATGTGPLVAGLALQHKRDGAPIHIDVIGVGSSPYDFLVDLGQHVLGVNVGEKAHGVAHGGRVAFFNYRSELWWRMREALDPEQNNGIALPPDPQLLADLTAPRYSLVGNAYKVESRDEIIKRIGRSPDWASAAILALIDTPKADLVRAVMRGSHVPVHDPFGHGVQGSRRPTYDPLANL